MKFGRAPSDGAAPMSRSVAGAHRISIVLDTILPRLRRFGAALKVNEIERFHDAGVVCAYLNRDV